MSINGGVARRLRAAVETARVARGLSKLELSELSGVARTTIDRLQTGRRPPAPHTVHALADAVGIDRRNAEVLACLVPATLSRPGGVDLRTAIEMSTLTPGKQDILLAPTTPAPQPARGEGARAGAW